MQIKLRQMRISKGMTQVDLAKSMGVTQQTISHWENKRREPKFSMIKKLCEIFECNISDIADLV